MSVKRFIVAVTLALSGLFAQASPAQQERTVLCNTVAANVKSGIDAKKVEMPEDVLYDRLMQYAMGLLASGYPQTDIKRLVTAVMEGYSLPEGSSPGKLQERLFKECMTQKDI
jgi:hypothetical protein